MEKPVRRARNKVQPLDKDVHVRIRNEYMEKLRKHAQEHKFTNSRMIRFIVEDYLDKQENWTPLAFMI